jgi:hypothetical protein
MTTKIMTVKQAIKIEVDGNPAILNELMYSSYEANRDNGLTHSQLLSIGLGNTDMLIRYNSKKSISEPPIN